MSPHELEKLEATVRAVVMRVLSEHASSDRTPASPARANLLVAVCCNDCVNDQSRAALAELQKAQFELCQPDESAFKKKREREVLLERFDGLLLPSLGDDDAAKMANGIFDEPVARLTLNALAQGKPVWAMIHAPYQNQIRQHAPQLYRLWLNHRKVLEGFGIQIIEYSRAAQVIGECFSQTTPRNVDEPSTLPVAAHGKKVLVSVKEIEAAAKNGASIKLPVDAIVTPLARDRAKELNVKLN